MKRRGEEEEGRFSGGLCWICASLLFLNLHIGRRIVVYLNFLQFDNVWMDFWILTRVCSLTTCRVVVLRASGWIILKAVCTVKALHQNKARCPISAPAALLRLCCLAEPSVWFFKKLWIVSLKMGSVVNVQRRASAGEVKRFHKVQNVSLWRFMKEKRRVNQYLLY